MRTIWIDNPTTYWHGYSWCELYGKAVDIDGHEAKWDGAPMQSYDDL